MGLQSKLWMLVEEASRSKKKQLPIDLDNIRAYIEKTVLLLGQTSDYITYFRRYNILAALNCPKQQSKETLREEEDFLLRHDRNLFGKKFSEHLMASAKLKKQAIEIFAEKGKKKQKPFRNTASEGPRRSSGEQHSKFDLDKRYGKSRQKYSTETTVQHAPISWNITKERNKEEHKGNLFQDVFSIYNSHGRSG